MSAALRGEEAAPSKRARLWGVPPALRPPWVTILHFPAVAAIRTKCQHISAAKEDTGVDGRADDDVLPMGPAVTSHRHSSLYWLLEDDPASSRPPAAMFNNTVTTTKSAIIVANGRLVEDAPGPGQLPASHEINKNDEHQFIRTHRLPKETVARGR